MRRKRDEKDKQGERGAERKKYSVNIYGGLRTTGGVPAPRRGV